MKKQQPKATNLLIALSVLSVLLVAGSIAGLYFGQDWLRTYKAESYQITIGAKTKIVSPELITQIQTAVNENSQYSKTALNLLVSSKSYKDIAQKTISAYASDAGIEIENSSFNAPSIPIGISGVNPVYTTITIKNPVSIDRLLRFMKAIESNMPKMQLSGINMSRAELDQNMVDIEPLTIEMYAR
jgi:hypothetical protein